MGASLQLLCLVLPLCFNDTWRKAQRYERISRVNIENGQKREEYKKNTLPPKGLECGSCSRRRKYVCSHLYIYKSNDSCRINYQYCAVTLGSKDNFLGRALCSSKAEYTCTGTSTRVPVRAHVLHSSVQLYSVSTSLTTYTCTRVLECTRVSDCNKVAYTCTRQSRQPMATPKRLPGLASFPWFWVVWGDKRFFVFCSIQGYVRCNVLQYCNTNMAIFHMSI